MVHGMWSGPAEECCRGTRPNHAAKSRLLVNVCGGGAIASSAVAQIGPMPAAHDVGSVDQARLSAAREWRWRLTNGLTYAGAIRRTCCPRCLDLTASVMRASTGLHRHYAFGLRRQKQQQFASRQLLAESRRAIRQRSMNLENVLHDIHADDANLCHGRLPP